MLTFRKLLIQPLLLIRKPSQTDKPNSVIDRSQVLPFIYDICHQIPVSAYPLTHCLRKIGRAALNHQYTWHFNSQGLPVLIVTNPNRELLPHIFTLTSLTERRLFSVALAGFRHFGIPSVRRCDALCCSDFPHF